MALADDFAGSVISEAGGIAGEEVGDGGGAGGHCEVGEECWVR